MLAGNWNLDVKTEGGWKTKEAFAHRSPAKGARERLLAEKHAVPVEELTASQKGDSSVLVRKGW